MKTSHILLIVSLLPALNALHGTAMAEAIVDIPKIQGIAVDGYSDDWGEAGLQVSWLSYMWYSGDKTRGPEEFQPTFRLAWNEDGLAMSAVLYDNCFDAPADDQLRWDLMADLAVVYVIPERGEKALTKIVISPDLTGKRTQSSTSNTVRVLVGTDADMAEKGRHMSAYRVVDPLERTMDIRKVCYPISYTRPSRPKAVADVVAGASGVLQSAALGGHS